MSWGEGARRFTGGTGLWIGWAVIGALAVAHVLYYAPRTVDDMYIFLRYAEQLAAGNGLVYNPGERVEGYSSPLWVVLLAAGEILGLGGVSWSKLLALVFFAALLWGVYAFGRERLGLSRWLALGGPLSVALNSYVVSWVLWGLETPAYLALFVWSAVLVGRVVEGRRATLALALVGSAFALSRPEAPLMIGLLGASAAVLPMRREAIVVRVRRALPAALAVVGSWGAYVVFRRLYFGLWLPHTHYAKRGDGFDIERLEPLIAQGASPFEAACTVLAVGVAIWLFVRKRASAPLAIFVGNAFFVTMVAIDWMPNARHFLPMLVITPVLVLALARQWLATGRRLGRVGAIGAVVVAVVGVGFIVAVDSRYSSFDHLTHGGGERWHRLKSARAVSDTWDCLRRVRPTHVEEMDSIHHGMITQLYHLLEADARPLEETWFVGRDIGRVGWLADAPIFDTAGLFTPVVVQSDAWQEDESVDEALLRAAFDRPVVIAYFDAPWVEALWRNPEVAADYQVSRDQIRLEYRFRRPPPAEQVLSRYEAALAKMPSAYYVMTLYGEAVGAALEKRYEHVKARHQHLSRGGG